MLQARAQIGRAHPGGASAREHDDVECSQILLHQSKMLAHDTPEPIAGDGTPENLARDGDAEPWMLEAVGACQHRQLLIRCTEIVGENASEVLAPM
jgi:hypothetical protein